MKKENPKHINSKINPTDGFYLFDEVSRNNIKMTL